MSRTKKHCPTCTCFKHKQKRHTCTICKTKKYEKFLELTGRYGAFGKPQWRCINRDWCQENVNYGDNKFI
jgi:hypothetical protein